MSQHEEPEPVPVVSTEPADAVSPVHADIAAPVPDGDAWPTVDGDVIESPAPSRRSRKLAVTLIAAAATVAVVLGGSAFALTRLWTGPTGTLPEDVVPGSVAAFARIDLSPGLGQRVKFEALLRRAAGNGPKSVDETKRKVFADLEAPIGYEDVAPWFDDRIGVALWSEGGTGGSVLLAVSTSDEDKARTALTAAQRKRGTDNLGFVVAGGYALLAIDGDDPQRLAEAAAAEAKKAPLSKASAFTSAVAKLPGDKPGLGWADLAQTFKLQEARLEAALMEEFAGEPMPSTPAEAEIKGTVVVGVQAVDSGIEIRSRVTGAAGLPLVTGTATAGDAVAGLGALPADATAAGVVTGPFGDPAAFGDVGDMLSSVLLPFALSGDDIISKQPLQPGDPDVDIEYVVPGPGDTFAFPPGVDPGDEEAMRKYIEEHPEIFAGDGTTFYGSGVDIEALDKATAALTKTITTARRVTFTIAGPSSDEAAGPPVELDLHLADAATAKQLHTDMAPLFKSGSMTAELKADHVIVRGKAYKPGTGKLADTDLFKAAMADPVANATSAAYIDGARSDMAPVKAVGITTGADGADTVVLARILI